MSIHDTTGNSIRSATREQSGIRYDDGDGGAQVNLSSLVATVEQVGGTDDRYTDELPDLPLPGHGEERDDCGDPIPRFCSDCGHVEMVGRTCNQSRCPRCWKGWDRKRAKGITAKLEALRAYKEAKRKGWDGWKFHHVVLSPPDTFKLNSDEPLQRTFDLVKEILDRLGGSTGYIFYHPYRGDNGDDRGFWKDLLPEEGDNPDMDETRAELSHEPHFHAVVLSKHVTGGFNTKVLEDKTGWLIERLTKGEESDVSIYDRYDLARVVTYSLSHVGIGESRAAYRPFGAVANFVAEPKFEKGMDAAVRSVAPNTLGLSYDDLTCREPRLIEGSAKVVMDVGHGQGDGDEQDDDDPDDDEECNGRLLDITKAPGFVNDDNWLREAPHADELQEAWEDWRFRVDTDKAD